MAKKNISKVVFIVSIVFNVLFLLLFLLGLGGSTVSFSLLNFGNDYLNSAFIVSVPTENSDVSFGPVEISLMVGSKAYLQFAALRDGRQSNLAMDPLYDHNVISVSQSGFGLVITALYPGEALLQLFSPAGFKDVAHVKVYQ